MCMTAIYEDKLGKRRNGWVVYNGKTNDFLGISDKQVKTQVEIGEPVLGLAVDEAGAVVVDTNFTTNLLAKTGLNTFTPILENGEPVAKSYVVVKVINEKSGTTYEVVSNRCGREVISVDKLRAMLMFMWVGGAKLVDDKIIIHESVAEIELNPKGNEKTTAKQV